MLNGFVALLNSEKAIAGGALVVAATVLVITGHMTVEQWQSYTQVVFLGYVGGKTIQGAVTALTSKSLSADRRETIEQLEQLVAKALIALAPESVPPAKPEPEPEKPEAVQ